jgi:hypothetical protein
MFAGPIPPDLAAVQDARQRLLSAVELGMQIMALLAFMLWVYRTNRNAWALGVEGMKHSPGWSVGWFFVPVMGLFMPYLVIKELWKASDSSLGREWRSAAVSPALGLWWTCCVVNAIIHYSPASVAFGKWNLVDIPRLGEDWLRAMREFFCGRVVADTAEIVVAVLTVVVVVSITVLQERQHGAINPSAVGPIDRTAKSDLWKTHA